jgi:hypothetical protein
MVDQQQFIGVFQRLSATGGSVVLPKGAFPKGTFAEMRMQTVFGSISAHIEFLHTGADGVPHAQAFRFLAMDDDSRKRFDAAAKIMQREGFSDTEAGPSTTAFGGLTKLRDSLGRLAMKASAGKKR